MTSVDKVEPGPSADEVPPGSLAGNSASVRVIGVLPEWMVTSLVELGQMTQLFAKVFYTAVRHPRGYWRDTLDEMYRTLRLCLLPSIGAVGLFLFMVGTFAVALLQGLGGEIRVGPVFVTTNMQETARWVTGMVIAGVVGTSMTADLGARRIREELDALKVLGMDVIRMLVVPKVITAAVMLSLMFIFSMLTSIVAVGSYVIAFDRVSSGAYFATLFNSVTVTQVWGGMLVTFLMGLATGIVCSHKGLTASGGAEGVGRAVNQAVVISFLFMFIINLGFNAIMQGAYPEMNVLR